MANHLSSLLAIYRQDKEELIKINFRKHRMDNQTMDNPEKLATLGTQDTGPCQRKQTKIHHYTQATTNNVNKA